MRHRFVRYVPPTSLSASRQKGQNSGEGSMHSGRHNEAVCTNLPLSLLTVPCRLSFRRLIIWRRHGLSRRLESLVSVMIRFIRSTLSSSPLSPSATLENKHAALCLFRKFVFNRGSRQGVSEQDLTIRETYLTKFIQMYNLFMYPIKPEQYEALSLIPVPS